MKTVKNTAVKTAMAKAVANVVFTAIRSNPLNLVKKCTVNGVSLEKEMKTVVLCTKQERKAKADAVKAYGKAKAKAVEKVNKAVYSFGDLITDKAKTNQQHMEQAIQKVAESVSGLAKVSTGSDEELIGRKVVAQDVSVLSTKVIDELFAKQGADVSNPVRQLIYALINIKRMLTVGEQLVDNVDTNSMSEVVEFCSAVRNAVRYNCTVATDENAYKLALGSKVADESGKVKTIKPFSDEFEHGFAVKEALAVISADLCGFRTQYSKLLPFATNFDKNDILLKGSVRLDSRRVTVDFGKNPSSILWSDLAKKIQYTSQVICYTSNSTGAVSEVKATDDGAKKGFGLIRKAIAMQKSNIDISGLVDNPDFCAVLYMAEGRNGVEFVEHLDSPYAHNLTNAEKNSAKGKIMLKVADKLEKSGYIAAYKAEVFGEHGYTQKGETVLKGDNSFITEKDGCFTTAEGTSKLIVRLAKCAQAKSRHIVKDVVMKVIALKQAPFSTTSAQYAFNQQLVRSLVSGQTYASPELFGETGVCRVVGGSEVGETGAKSVIVDPLYCFVQEALGSVAMTLGGVDGIFVGRFAIAGIPSTKSASFKTKDGFVLKSTIFQGEEVYFYTKETVEQLQVTDSAVTEAYEINPETLVKLTGTAAAVDTYDRRIQGKKSETVFDLVYGGRKENETLYDVVCRLVSKGTIRAKKAKARLNAQVLLGAEFQHGRATAEALVRTVLSQNMNSQLRDNMLLAKDIAENKADAVELPLAHVVEYVKNTLLESGHNFENASQQVYNIDVVHRVIHVLAKYAGTNTAKRIAFTHTDDKGTKHSVPVVVGDAMLSDLEEVEREGHVRVSGLLADILFAIHKGLSTSIKTTKVGGKDVHTIEVSDSSYGYMIKDMAKARDNALGKDLTRVNVHGLGGHIVVSPVLVENEMFGYNLLSAKMKAEGCFCERVAAIYFKPPTLWEGSLTGAKVLGEKGIFDILKDRGVEEYFDLLFVSKQYHTVMNGNSAYHSPEKVIYNGNDVDGDRYVVAFLPAFVVAFMTTLQADRFVDATKTSVAVAGNSYKTKWEEEVSSLYLDSVRNNAVTTEKDLVTFSEDVHKAVLGASEEKKNVAIYTSYQMVVLQKKDAFINGVIKALEKGAEKNAITGIMSLDGTVDVEFYNALSKISDKEVQSFAFKYIAEQVYSFTCGVMGSVVNMDAMDLIKQKEAGAVRLANLLSPRAVYFAANPKATVSDNPLYVERVQVEGATAGNIATRMKNASAMMFDANSYNFSLERINHIFPSTLSSKVEKQNLVVRLMFLGLNFVGQELETTVDVVAELVKDNSTLSLEERVVIMENQEQLEGKSVVANTSLIGFCFEIAEEMRGKRLQTVN